MKMHRRRLSRTEIRAARKHASWRKMMRRDAPTSVDVLVTARTRGQAERLACAMSRRDGETVAIGNEFGKPWVLWKPRRSLVPDGVSPLSIRHVDGIRTGGCRMWPR
jgi:hypothetical protein